MNFSEKLNQIKVILGLEVKLAQEKLIDGVTVVEAEEFEPGYPVFIVNEDGSKTPAPEGSHETESGLVVTVDAEGKIVEVSPKAEVPEVEQEIEVEMAEVPVVEGEVKEEVKAEVPDMAEALKKVALAIEEVANDVATIKAEMASMKEKYEKFSKTPGAAKAPAITREASAVLDPLEAKVAALQQLKKENFFKIK